jgi:hypothetical protein
MIRSTVLAVIALGLTGAVPPQAGAQVLERIDYSGTFSGDEVSCGRPVHFEGTYSGTFMIRSRGDRSPSGFDHYQVHEVFTDAHGDGYIIDQGGIYSEVRVRHLRGNIYRVTAINVGQVFVVRTLAGKAVYRNLGLLEFTYIVNTQGDSDLGNDVLVEDLGLTRDAGRHPELTSTDEEFCAQIDKAMAG